MYYGGEGAEGRSDEHIHFIRIELEIVCVDGLFFTQFSLELGGKEKPQHHNCETQISLPSLARWKIETHTQCVCY